MAFPNRSQSYFSIQSYAKFNLVGDHPARIIILAQGKT